MAELTSFVLGAAAGAIFTAAIAYPRVGRITTRVLGVALLSIGAGVLVWTILALMRDEEMSLIVRGSVLVAQPSEAFGWSAGMLSASIGALVLSFLGRPH